MAEKTDSKGFADMSIETINAEMMRSLVDSARISMSSIEDISRVYFEEKKLDQLDEDQKKEIIENILPGVRDMNVALFIQRVYLSAICNDVTEIEDVIKFIRDETTNVINEVFELLGISVQTH